MGDTWVGTSYLDIVFDRHVHVGEAQLARHFEVLARVHDARGHAPSLEMHKAEDTESIGETLSRGLLEPWLRLLIVHGDAEAIVVHHADLVLAHNMARLGSDLVRRHCQLVVDRLAVAVHEDASDGVSGSRVTLDGRRHPKSVQERSFAISYSGSLAVASTMNSTPLPLTARLRPSIFNPTPPAPAHLVHCFLEHYDRAVPLLLFWGRQAPYAWRIDRFHRIPKVPWCRAILTNARFPSSNSFSSKARRQRCAAQWARLRYAF